MAEHGGPRKGAGRPMGGQNKLNAEALERAKEGGVLPLDYLLGIMRDGERADDVRLDAAKAAAPYVHAKLAAISVDGNMKLSIGSALDDLPD